MFTAVLLVSVRVLANLWTSRSNTGLVEITHSPPYQNGLSWPICISQVYGSMRGGFVCIFIVVVFSLYSARACFMPGGRYTDYVFVRGLGRFVLSVGGFGWSRMCDAHL
jgi:hypothetical protein